MIGGGAVIELSEVVFTPAPDILVHQLCAGEFLTGGDAEHFIGQAGNFDRNIAVGGGSVAQLAGAVLTPAPDLAADGECAGMFAAGSQVQNTGEVFDIDRFQLIDRGSIAKLT